ASSKENADDVRTAEAQWLQKTAAEIKQFGVDEALCDVSCLSFQSAIMDGSPQVAETLHEQEVDGEDVLDLTYQRLVAEPYKIAAGPAGKLAKRIAALSCPSMAASGFQ
ncbi:unnamed protein product, partial [Symbiodinium sp. CCMP2456]